MLCSQVDFPAYDVIESSNIFNQRDKTSRMKLNESKFDKQRSLNFENEIGSVLSFFGPDLAYFPFFSTLLQFYPFFYHKHSSFSH